LLRARVIRFNVIAGCKFDNSIRFRDQQCVTVRFVWILCGHAQNTYEDSPYPH